MDLADMQHKIDPMHEGMLRRMLGVNEVPEAVLRRYFSLKSCLDKVDAKVSPCELLRIAMDVGFNTDTKRFDGEVPSYEITTEELENVVEEEVPDDTPKPDPEVAKIEQQMKEADEEVDDGTLKAGTEVKIFRDGVITDCTIESYDKDDETYTVKIEYDDETGETVDNLTIEDIEV